MIRIIVFVLTGRAGSIEPLGFLSVLVCQPIYNILRSPERQKVWSRLHVFLPSLTWLYISTPFIRIWSAFTPFAETCHTTAVEKSVSQRVITPWREVFYLLWMALVGAALGRGMGANSTLYGLLGSMCLMSLALGSLTYFALDENDLGTSSHQFRIRLSLIFCLIISSLLLNQR